MPLIYMSFADDAGFLGGAIVEAPSMKAAPLVAHILGINPGGEVMLVDVDEDLQVPDEWKGRLLTREQVEQLDAELTKARH